MPKYVKVSTCSTTLPPAPTQPLRLTIKLKKTFTQKKILGCFKQILGQIWTNPAIGLHFLITFFNPMFPYLTQNWVKTTQHFLWTIN